MHKIITQNTKGTIKTLNYLLTIILVLCLGLGMYIVKEVYNHYRYKAENDALALSESAAAFINPENLVQLSADHSDAEKPEYTNIKDSLIRFKEQNPNVAFAYLLAAREGRLLFLVDSEPSWSEDYSPPGQEYYEATEQDFEPFKFNKPVVTKPTHDRWGTWISVLIPIANPKTGEVLASFGVDYPDNWWAAEINRHVYHAFVVIVCIMLFIIAIYFYAMKRIELREKEKLFINISEKAPIGIAVVEAYEDILFFNKTLEDILGRPKEDVANLGWTHITHPDDLEEDLQLYQKFKSGEISGYTIEKRYIRPDGAIVWVQMIITGLQYKHGLLQNHLCIIQDITERKNAEVALTESERSKSVLLSHLQGMAFRCHHDRDWTMQFVSDGCLELTGYPSESFTNKDVSFSSIIPPAYRELIWREWERVLSLKLPFRYEHEIITASGQHKWVLGMGQGIYNTTDDIEALEGIIIDITELKKRENQIQYMTNHDIMTGLYNRSYYDIVKNELDCPDSLPLAIITADINGIRIINDAFGHEEGDSLIRQTAEIMKSCCRETDILARTGGGEFTIIMPNTDKEHAYQIIQIIKNRCTKYNLNEANKSRHISLSIGYGIKNTKDEMLKVVEKEAEDYMKKRKLLDRNSHHSAILSSVIATMYARSQETEEHAERLSIYCKKIGEGLGLLEKSLDDLRLLSMLHDIGKVGIDDRILNKPGKLTDEEWLVMKKHPEIGCRIAKATQELESIAEYILYHHERWDGNGYPKGLKGTDIPLLSRILAIADAFDAMTEDRVYRKALPKHEAIQEIKRNAGKQFDPYIAQVFIDKVWPSIEYS